jgi:hexulose-6-phosphate isomerase
MQAPFFKAKGPRAIALRDELHEVLGASAELGIRFVLIPLVDNGRIEGPEDADRLRAGLVDLEGLLNDAGMKILFESDFAPHALRHFIATLSTEKFGLTYDIGNSASLGFDPNEEFAAYGDRIDNVHVKDRICGGTTVPLGQGAADLPLVFRLLRKSAYRGDFILQTARASNGEHAAALCRYRDLVRGWLAGVS